MSSENNSLEGLSNLDREKVLYLKELFNSVPDALLTDAPTSDDKIKRKITDYIEKNQKLAKFLSAKDNKLITHQEMNATLFLIFAVGNLSDSKSKMVGKKTIASFIEKLDKKVNEKTGRKPSKYYTVLPKIKKIISVHNMDWKKFDLMYYDDQEGFVLLSIGKKLSKFLMEILDEKIYQFLFSL